MQISDQPNLTLDLDKNEIFYNSLKRILRLRLVELQSLVAKCCKIRKYSLAKFANFVYICITQGKVTIFAVISA